MLAEILHESVYLYLCSMWALSRGPQRALDGGEDNMVLGDTASDSSDVDVLGGLCTCACCLCLVYVNKGGRSFGVECGNTRKSAHPLVRRACKVHRPWALFRESMVQLQASKHTYLETGMQQFGQQC